MIMDKEWLVNYAEKNIVHLMTLLKDEYEEVNPAKRDVATIIHLQDAINFYDTVLCITGVLHSDFDKHLALIYNKAKEEKEVEEDESADQSIREEDSTQDDRGDS